jgi:hypothetical protein
MGNFRKQFFAAAFAACPLLTASIAYAQVCTVPPTNTGAYPWPVWSPTIPVVPPSTTGKTLYVDGTNGNDASNGLAVGTAFKTIGRALSNLAAGDTILIRKGLYREPINLNAKSVPSGTLAKPITIGSYGDGEVIVDGSPKVNGWRRVAGTIWEATINFAPTAVVVNEVPLKQVTQGQNGSTAPQVGKAGVTSGSGKWHIGGGILTADMGTAIGSGDPNLADIVVPKFSADQEHVFFFRQSYITFKGLTIRGSGSNGIWGYGSNITVDSCNIKFNGKAAVSFIPDSDPNILSMDNKVLYSHIYQNVMQNWPRGNNGFAESGGGWPGTVVWSGNLRPVARGNIVYMNGGEGIISYGSINGKQTGSALFEQNVAYDNWSVNMYFDNQPNNIARNNFLYNHPIDPSNYLYWAGPNNDPWGILSKYSTCLMLADEYNSGASSTGFAALDYTQVYNNVIANCRIGIRDYAEGSPTAANHGLRNTLIANNTIILPNNQLQGTDVFGIYLQDNGTRNVNTVIQNNVIYGFTSGTSPIGTGALMFSQKTGPLSGISLNNNVYYTLATKPFGAGNNSVTYYDFAGWKTATGADSASRFQDPKLVDVTKFAVAGPAPYNPLYANLAAGSGAAGAGAFQGSYANNFELKPRNTWNAGAY